MSNCHFLPNQWTHIKKIFWIYFQVIFYAIVICGVRVLRVSYGPLPIYLCNIAGFLNGCAILFATITVVMYTFARFMFVCVWKGMRQVDDDLIVRIATIQAIVMSLFFQGATWLQLQRQLTIPVSFFGGFSVFWRQLSPSPTNTYLVKFISGLYWNSSISKLYLLQTKIINISICSIFLHSHCNWTYDCNTKETSH